MRVALITDGIAPYVIGGMQKHSFYLAKYLAKNQIFVDLVHYNHSAYDILKLEVFNDDEKKYINSIVLQFPTSAKFPGHYLYNSYKYSCLAYNAIKDKLPTYDFIYTKGFTGWKLITQKHNKTIICCKIGVNFHGYEMFQIAPNFKSKLQQYILKSTVKKISKQANVVFSYGGKITEIIQSIGVPLNHIIELPSGVEKTFINTTISTNKNSVTKFVFLGRAERRKGIIELNEVLTELLKTDYKFEIEFIGPIPEHLKIKHHTIIYNGEIRDAHKIKALLSKNDVLVCPSWSEGFPNVILEAMACGLAIIGTNVGAVSAMVSNANGWIIEPANKIQLQTAIINAITCDDLTLKKQNSLQLVNTKFNWDIIAQKTIKAIQ